MNELLLRVFFFVFKLYCQKLFLRCFVSNILRLDVGVYLYELLKGKFRFHLKLYVTNVSYQKYYVAKIN